MQSRELAALERRIAAAERTVGSERAGRLRAEAMLLQARIYITALRLILINKNVCTAADFATAVNAAKSQILP